MNINILDIIPLIIEVLYDFSDDFSEVVNVSKTNLKFLNKLEENAF